MDLSPQIARENSSDFSGFSTSTNFSGFSSEDSSALSVAAADSLFDNYDDISMCSSTNDVPEGDPVVP